MSLSFSIFIYLSFKIYLMHIENNRLSFSYHVILPPSFHPTTRVKNEDIIRGWRENSTGMGDPWGRRQNALTGCPVISCYYSCIAIGQGMYESTCISRMCFHLIYVIWNIVMVLRENEGERERETARKADERRKKVKIRMSDIEKDNYHNC